MSEKVIETINNKREREYIGIFTTHLHTPTQIELGPSLGWNKVQRVSLAASKINMRVKWVEDHIWSSSLRGRQKMSGRLICGDIVYPWSIPQDGSGHSFIPHWNCLFGPITYLPLIDGPNGYPEVEWSGNSLRGHGLWHMLVEVHKRWTTGIAVTHWQTCKTTGTHKMEGIVQPY